VYQLTGNTLTVRLTDQATPSGSYVIADAVRVERIGELPLGPEIQVLVGGVELADGTGSLDFGNTLIGTPARRTITVNNVGTLDLSLGNITLPNGFSQVTGFGSTVLAPGQTTNIVIQLDGLVAGSYSGVMSFGTNDADENPFDIRLSGTVSGNLPSVWFIDDGDPEYSASGGWNVYSGLGADGDFSYKGVGNGAGVATWTLSGLISGQYRVSVTWESYTNRAMDATYRVLDGSAVLGTVAVNQRQVPAGFVEYGVWWQDLGVYQLTGNTLTVRLTDQATPSGSYVIADAVRVERVD